MRGHLNFPVLTLPSDFPVLALPSDFCRQTARLCFLRFVCVGSILWSILWSILQYIFLEASARAFPSCHEHRVKQRCNLIPLPPQDRARATLFFKLNH